MLYFFYILLDFGRKTCFELFFLVWITLIGPCGCKNIVFVRDGSALYIICGFELCVVYCFSF